MGEAMKKKRVGLLGCTGMVGQQYLQFLANHPQFEITFLAASEASAGKTYKQAVQGRWLSGLSLERSFGDLLVHSIEEVGVAKNTCDFVFSAVSTEAAKLYEEKYAQAGLPVPLIIVMQKIFLSSFQK
jgi:aspartate-semialdehyde dehydrogenase